MAQKSQGDEELWVRFRLLKLDENFHWVGIVLAFPFLFPHATLLVVFESWNVFVVVAIGFLSLLLIIGLTLD